jgi:hypothetical protein
VGKPAGNLYAFDYSSSAKSTFLTPHFLISLLSEVLFSITNRITCLLFNGVETLGEEKLYSLYTSAFFRASQIISASPKLTDSLIFYRNVARWKANFYGQYDSAPERKKGDLLKNCFYI